MRLISPGELADQLRIDPKIISTVIYRVPSLRQVCQLIGGRRSIPEEAIGPIIVELRRLGQLPAKAVERGTDVAGN